MRWTITSTWLVLLFALSVRASVITNPSFESERHGVMPNGVSTADHETWGMPDGWSFRQSGPVNGHGVRREDAVGWAADGAWSLYLFVAGTSRPQGHVPGDYLEFYQTINLSDVSSISFDVYLKGGSQHSRFYVAIDSDKLWTRSAAGTVRDVALDVSSYSGWHNLTIGVEVLEAFGGGGDGWAYFDHFVAVPEPATLALLVVPGLFRRRRS